MAEERADPLVHIGYHRTGTTWLQWNLFSHTSRGFLAAPRKEINEILVRPNALDFDAEAARAAFRDSIQGAADEGLVPVLSQERISGNYCCGGYDNKEVAHRVHRLFPGAKVLIVIREQRSMVLSGYKQYAREGGVQGLSRFLHPKKRLRSWPVFDLAYFEYDRLIRCYRELFGADRVLVLPYEMLRSEPEQFVSRICEVCGTSVPEGLDYSRRDNVSYTGPVLAVKRWFNLFFMRGPMNPGCIIPVGENWIVRELFKLSNRLVPGFVRRWSDRRMLARIARAAGERYRESNARTAEMTGLDLAGYGYDMPQE